MMMTMLVLKHEANHCDVVDDDHDDDGDDVDVDDDDDDDDDDDAGDHDGRWKIEDGKLMMGIKSR